MLMVSSKLASFGAFSPIPLISLRNALLAGLGSKLLRAKVV
jgi:hypothetical protein